jgi:hypothetical protein
MTSRFPVAFRPPAFASWTSCSRQGRSALLTVGLPTMTVGPCRGFHVPHEQDTAGAGALFTPGRWCPPGCTDFQQPAPTVSQRLVSRNSSLFT